MNGANALAVLPPGFEDTFQDGQTVFGGILDATARPGTVTTIGPCPTAPPPMMPAVAAVLQCLADMDTPLWLDPALATPSVREYFRFHCNAPYADGPEGAKFAVISDAAEMPVLSIFNPGDELYPDRSATVLVAVAGFDRGTRFELTGPGIQTRQALSVDGLPGWFPAAWARNRKNYPTGVDVLLCSGDSIVGLPRSVTLELSPCI